jgi:23S rRNA (guanosine2251-2'-O)-methyltransferase
MLDGVTDPYNVGAVLRVAECAGAAGVVLPRHRASHITPAATKAAAGAIERLKIALVAGIPGALTDMTRLGFWTVGLEASAKTDFFSLDLGDTPIALVLGSEGKGLSRLARERCDVLARLPVVGALGSLNVSTAAAIACYEVLRQRDVAAR